MNRRNTMVPGTMKGLGTFQFRLLYALKAKGMTFDQIANFKFPDGRRSASYVWPLVRSLERRKLITKKGDKWYAVLHSSRS